jgi:transketolase
VQEEVSQGAGRIAGHLGLDNLIMFFDANDIQLSTPTADVISEDTAAKYRAWNWNVLEIDGNDVDQIRQALKAANEELNRPTLIIGHCVMGKGARKADNTSYECNCATHGAPLGGEAYLNTIKNLDADPENPFVIWPETAALYEQRKAELRKIVAERRAEETQWANQNQEKASKLKDWFDNKLPNLPWSDVQQTPNAPTRNASANCLAMLSKHVENMIVKCRLVQLR